MTVLSISNVNYRPDRDRKAQLSRHAKRRSQQRGIGGDVLPLLLAYGERSHDGQGGIRCLMTDKAMATLVRAVGRTQRVDALAGAYFVLSGDDERVVITVSHRYS